MFGGEKKQNGSHKDNHHLWGPKKGHGHVLATKINQPQLSGSDTCITTSGDGMLAGVRIVTGQQLGRFSELRPRVDHRLDVLRGFESFWPESFLRVPLFVAKKGNEKDNQLLLLLFFWGGGGDRGSPKTRHTQLCVRVQNLILFRDRVVFRRELV